MNTNAYWISPDGKILPVTTTHIDMVIKNPETFGHTDESIKEIYDSYNEPVGQEGQAREQIIIDLIKKGWIRVRKYGNKGWSLNLQKLTTRIKDYIFNFADKITSEGLFGIKEKDLYSPVNIISFVDNAQMTYTFKQLLSSVMYEGKEKFNPKNILIEVKLEKNKWIDIYKRN